MYEKIVTHLYFDNIQYKMKKSIMNFIGTIIKLFRYFEVYL